SPLSPQVTPASASTRPSATQTRISLMGTSCNYRLAGQHAGPVPGVHFADDGAPLAPIAGRLIPWFSQAPTNDAHASYSGPTRNRPAPAESPIRETCQTRSTKRVPASRMSPYRLSANWRRAVRYCTSVIVEPGALALLPLGEGPGLAAVRSRI